MVIILKITLFRVALAEHPKRKYLLREQHWDGWLVETALWSQVWRSQTHWSGSFSFAAECLDGFFSMQTIQVSNKTKWICEISIEILFRSQKDALQKKTPMKLRLQLTSTGHLRKRFRLAEILCSSAVFFVQYWSWSIFTAMQKCDPWKNAWWLFRSWRVGGGFGWFWNQKIPTWKHRKVAFF